MINFFFLIKKKKKEIELGDRKIEGDVKAKKNEIKLKE